MTKFHTEPQNQSTQGQGFRRCNSIGGITRLSRRRIRRLQRRFHPFRVVSSSRGSNPVSMTRGDHCPSLELPDVVSETRRCRDTSSAGRYTSSDVNSDHSVTWTVTDVSTPQGRKLIIKRGGMGSCPTKHQNGNVSFVKCRLSNGSRKRIAAMSQNYPEKMSGSDESVEGGEEVSATGRCEVSAPGRWEVSASGRWEVSAPGRCEVSATLPSQGENSHIRDGLSTNNDVIKGELVARNNDVTFTDCRRLRRENTLIVDSDGNMEGVTNPVTTSVTDPVTDHVTDLITNLDYNYFVDLRHQDRADHQQKDMLVIPSERFSYKSLLAPVQHFRCVLCDTNLEALTLGTVGESLDIMDLSRFHIENRSSDVNLFCPECGFSQIGYR